MTKPVEVRFHRRPAAVAKLLGRLLLSNRGFVVRIPEGLGGFLLAKDSPAFTYGTESPILWAAEVVIPYEREE